jgi:hypothetical protein
LGSAPVAGLDTAGAGVLAAAGVLAGAGALDVAAALGADALAAALVGDAAAVVDGLLAFFAELLQAAIARAAAMTGTTKRAPFLDMAMTGTAFLWVGGATVEISSKRFDDVAAMTVGASGSDVNTCAALHPATVTACARI